MSGPPPPPPPPPAPPMSMMMMMGGAGGPAPPPPSIGPGDGGDRSDLLKAIAEAGNRPKLRKVDPSQIKDRSKPVVPGGASSPSGSSSNNALSNDSSTTKSKFHKPET